MAKKKSKSREFTQDDATSTSTPPRSPRSPRSQDSPTSPVESYYESTDPLTQFFDKYLIYCMLQGISIFIYCFIMGTFPFNAFLAAFIYSVGCFVMVANLRNAEKPREFGEFVACILVLNAFVSNYLG